MNTKYGMVFFGFKLHKHIRVKTELGRENIALALMQLHTHSHTWLWRNK